MSQKTDGEPKSPTLNLDGVEYEIAGLPKRAQGAVQFLQRVERELSNLRYEIDKCALARAKASEDLKKLIAEKPAGESGESGESIQ